MKDSSRILLQKIENAVAVFKSFSEDDWNYKYGPDKWSKREILGHLIDSAANNHQRFVRVQFEEIPNIVYAQDKWVEVQKYDDESVLALIDLWASYNKHIAYIINNIPEENLSRFCDINLNEPVTLEWLINDYVEKHMEHHLNQIFE